MKKLYQTEWHNIKFESFVKMSPDKIADTDFYTAFYSAFFKKYMGIEDLEQEWLRLKLQVSELIRDKCRLKKEHSVLSIGCGLGVTEKRLIDEGYNVEITEVTEKALKWLLPHISPEKVYLGIFPDCLPAVNRYDVIYLASVEYALTDKELLGMLKAVKDRLLPGGVCSIISWSFDNSVNTQSAFRRIAGMAVNIVRNRKPSRGGQFWGYIRKRGEFHKIMRKAGFSEIADGIMEKKTRWDTYWISGVNK